MLRQGGGFHAGFGADGDGGLGVGQRGVGGFFRPCPDPENRQQQGKQHRGGGQNGNRLHGVSFQKDLTGGNSGGKIQC